MNGNYTDGAKMCWTAPMTDDEFRRLEARVLAIELQLGLAQPLPPPTTEPVYKIVRSGSPAGELRRASRNSMAHEAQ